MWNFRHFFPSTCLNVEVLMDDLSRKRYFSKRFCSSYLSLTLTLPRRQKRGVVPSSACGTPAVPRGRGAVRDAPPAERRTRSPQRSARSAPRRNARPPPLQRDRLTAAWFGPLTARGADPGVLCWVGTFLVLRDCWLVSCLLACLLDWAFSQSLLLV